MIGVLLRERNLLLIVRVVGVLKGVCKGRSTGTRILCHATAELQRKEAVFLLFREDDG